jgi:hypothetical protein
MTPNTPDTPIRRSEGSPTMPIRRWGEETRRSGDLREVQPRRSGDGEKWDAKIPWQSQKPKHADATVREVEVGSSVLTITEEGLRN